jgi:membrane fusion protein (multidrug efflux system)
MKSAEDKNSYMPDGSEAARPADAAAVTSRAPDGTTATPANPGRHPEPLARPADGSPSAVPPQPPVATPPKGRLRKWLLWAGIVAALGAGGYYLIPWVETELNTVSTDDAYVNGHVTYVAPRVSGKVAKVLVEDNRRVKKGDLLVHLDKEPYEVQVSLKRAAVQIAEKNMVAAEAQARGLEAQIGSQRWKLQNASEQVNTQIAKLHAAIATLGSRKASLELAKANLRRAELLVPSGGISKENLDERRQTAKVCQAAVLEALQEVYALRVGLGLPALPPKGQDLSEVPPDLDQTFSAVRMALDEGHHTLAQLGMPLNRIDVTPKQALENFRRLDKDGDIDRILRDLIPKVPAVMQAEAQLKQARHDLEQAELNLRYCDVTSDIDGVVTGRNVNPGNYVQIGQQLMAVRSLTEIWIDANFKETQLADLRIGQRVRCEVDMYGGRQEFEGRITGFTMGTGQTLALLPPQNATGNFVKIVQRLPVRIELTDYDPDKTPLFVGLSVTPYVYYKEPPTGPGAGEVLQPLTTHANREPKSEVGSQKR